MLPILIFAQTALKLYSSAENLETAGKLSKEPTFRVTPVEVEPVAKTMCDEMSMITGRFDRLEYYICYFIDSSQIHPYFKCILSTLYNEVETEQHLLISFGCCNIVGKKSLVKSTSI